MRPRKYCFATQSDKLIAESAFDEHYLSLLITLMDEALNEKEAALRTLPTPFNFPSLKLKVDVEFVVSEGTESLKMHSVKINTELSSQKPVRTHMKTAISFLLRILPLAAATDTGERSLDILQSTLINIKKVMENIFK